LLADLVMDDADPLDMRLGDASLLALGEADAETCGDETANWETMVLTGDLGFLEPYFASVSALSFGIEKNRSLCFMLFTISLAL